MEPCLLDSRMGSIVEKFGGRFKLKTRDCIFHGLPLAGLYHAVEGLPPESPRDILLTKDLPELVHSIRDVIGDFMVLNRMRQNSLKICESEFRWQERGVRLFDAIRKIRSVALSS